MTGSGLVLHVLLITVHAAAATGCFVLGLLLVRRVPASADDRRLRWFAALVVLAVITLVAVVGVDWSGLPVGKRIAFAALCALAAFLLVRAGGAVRCVLRRPTSWRRAVVQHVGFVLISLFDGFCVVSAIDLGLPPPAVFVVAVLGVVGGVLALRRAVRRIEDAPPPTAA